MGPSACHRVRVMCVVPGLVGSVGIVLVIGHPLSPGIGPWTAPIMTRPARMRDFRGWGILSVLMQRVTRKSGLLAAILVAPLIAGCSALGLPEGPASLDITGAADAADPAATLAPVPSPVQLSSNDGYSLTLPAGWVGSRTNNEATRAVLAAIGGGDPLLGAEASALYEATDADLSMVAADAIRGRPRAGAVGHGDPRHPLAARVGRYPAARRGHPRRAWRP